MPNVEILKRMIEAGVDDTLDLPRTLDLLNAGQRQMASFARIRAKTLLPFTPEAQVIALPNSILEVTKVTFKWASGGETPPPSGVSFTNSYIEWESPLPEGGTIRVEYFRYPAELTAMDSVSEIPLIGHDGLVQYAIREYLDADDEDGIKADQKYKFILAQLDDNTKRETTSMQPVMPDSRPPWMRRKG